MRALQLVLQFFAVITIAKGTFINVNHNIPEGKRCVKATISFLAGTLFTVAGLGACLIANGGEWTFSAGFLAFSLLITAHAFVLQFLDLKHYTSCRKKAKEVVESSTVSALDNGVKILLLAGNIKLPRDGLFLCIPDGVEPYCTLGLGKAYNHPELSIVLKLEDGLAEKILAEIIKRVAAGEKFEPGQMIHGVTNTDMKTYRSNEPIQGEPLRLIFPDANGRWPDDNRCNPVVAKQILSYKEIWNIVIADQSNQ